MKKVEIAVCDDEYIHVERIVKYIGVYSEESEIDINVTEYNSGKLLLEAVEGDTSKYDIIFLDVEMPDFDGVNTARGIRKVSEDVIICFVTSFDKYAIQAYGVEALAYVVKPVAYAELKRVLSRAVVLVQYTFDYKEAEERYIEVPVSRNIISYFKSSFSISFNNAIPELYDVILIFISDSSEYTSIYLTILSICTCSSSHTAISTVFILILISLFINKMYHNDYTLSIEMCYLVFNQCYSE